MPYSSGPGTYELVEPIVFTPEDSGTETRPVTWAAFPGEQAPIVSGGKRIDGWRTGENGVWHADMPAVKEGRWYFRQLFTNGKRRMRARIPNEGFFQVEGSVAVEEPSWFISRQGDFDPAWAAQKDTEVIVLQAWAEIRHHITAYDPVTRTVTLSRQCSPYNREKDARYYLENVREGLDSPGEWYLDRETGVLSYIPLPGEDMNSIAVVAPVATELVRFEGDPENKRFVEHITMRGLEFEHTDWSLPDEGYSDLQAAHDIPTVITGTGARNVTIDSCVIRHHGNYAIGFDRGCRDVTISACRMSDLGAGGVKIGEPVNRDNEAEQTGHCAVTDNVIYDIGEVYPAACGVIIFLSGNNRIAHNEIYNTYYTGISNGWSWGYKETNTRDNIIEYNHVHNIGRGMLSDMGGNYNLGVQPGTIIRNNLFHDIDSHGYGGWGIYTDEGSSYITIENNLVHHTKSGGFHQHYGRENIVRNNIFAFARIGQIIRSRMEDHLSFTFTNNIVYWSEGPLLGSNWSDDKYALDYNCYYNTTGEPVMFKDWTFDEWKARGQDTHSIIADPLFADPENGDFTLQEGSPAFDIGFKAFSLKNVGPRLHNSR